jgi:hypothetical protein
VTVLHDDVQAELLPVDIALVVANNVLVWFQVLQNVAVEGECESGRALAELGRQPERRHSHFLAELLQITLVHPAVVEFLFIRARAEFASIIVTCLLLTGKVPPFWPRPGQRRARKYRKSRNISMDTA